MPNVNHRIPKKPVGSVREWITKLKFRRQGSYGRKAIQDDQVYLLAGLLALCGPPGDREAQIIFRNLSDFLFHMRRPTTARIGEALKAIPPDPEKIRRVARALQTWRDITGMDMTRQKYRAPEVIMVTLEIPDPVPYVRHLKDRGLTALNAVYHPNTLRRAKRELRGLFSGTDGTDGYWDRTRDQLDIISDE